MEPQTRFDLDRALNAWRVELAGQPGVSAENVRELETHLRESIAAFQRRGLSDAEAFSQASRKLGSARELGAEFAKVNPVQVWRDRVFWMTAIPLLLVFIYQVTEQPLRQLAQWVDASLGVSRSPITLAVLRAVPTLLVAAAMASGRLEIVLRKLRWLFADRWRLAAAGVIAILATAIAGANSPELFHDLAALAIFECGFLGFAVLIWPKEIAAVGSANVSRLNGWRDAIGLWRERLFWVVLGCLAINVWNLVPAVGAAAFLRFNGQEHYVATPGPATVCLALGYLAVWLLPMAVVGLVLANAWLADLAHWLRTRRRAGVAATSLALMWLALTLWMWRWAVLPEYILPADWNFRMQHATLTGLIVDAIMIAMMIKCMPASAAPPADTKNREVTKLA